MSRQLHERPVVTLQPGDARRLAVASVRRFAGACAVLFSQLPDTMPLLLLLIVTCGPHASPAYCCRSCGFSGWYYCIVHPTNEWTSDQTVLQLIRSTRRSHRGQFISRERPSDGRPYRRRHRGACPDL